MKTNLTPSKQKKSLIVQRSLVSKAVFAAIFSPFLLMPSIGLAEQITLNPNDSGNTIKISASDDNNASIFADRSYGCWFVSN